MAAHNKKLMQLATARIAMDNLRKIDLAAEIGVDNRRLGEYLRCDRPAPYEVREWLVKRLNLQDALERLNRK
jgi:hypothetical protein